MKKIRYYSFGCTKTRVLPVIVSGNVVCVAGLLPFSLGGLACHGSKAKTYTVTTVFRCSKIVILIIIKNSIYSKQYNYWSAKINYALCLSFLFLLQIYYVFLPKEYMQNYFTVHHAILQGFCYIIYKDNR